MPASERVQAKERIAGYVVTSDELGDTILKGLHDHLGLCLGLLAFTRELDLMEGDKSTANTLHPAEIVEGVFKLRKPEVLLTADNTS